MRPRTHRRIDNVLLVVIALALGVAAVIGAVAGDGERITGYWVGGALDGDGTLNITEVIDFDFGFTARHGIDRDVPGLDLAAPVEVDSPTAPDSFRLIDQGRTTRIRVGDPNVTITGRHRYTIRYPLTTVTAPEPLFWNAIGSEWDVSITGAEIHLVLPYRAAEVTCSRGRTGSTGGCTATEVEPGHVVVRPGKLGANEGVTVGVTPGPALASPPSLPPAPTGPVSDPGWGIALPALVAVLTAMAAAVGTTIWVRREGREMVWAGGAVNAALGPRDSLGAPIRRMDVKELAKLATIQFHSPKDLDATHGAIVYTEATPDRLLAAWLIEAATRGEVEITKTGDELKLIRGKAATDPEVEAILDTMFRSRHEIDLTSYDADFRKGWLKLRSRLKAWQRESGLWNPRGRAFQTTVRVVGALIGAAGLAGTALFAALGNRTGAIWLPLLILAAAAGAAGLTALIESWELLIRSPRGSAQWLQVESFRRFLHDSEATHVEQAAQMGLLREFTAWAVALNETDAWSRAVERAAAEQPGFGDVYASDLYLVSLAPSLVRSAGTASTKPSSSGGGGGGGFGGSVGGGFGGGGGGSW